MMTRAAATIVIIGIFVPIAFAIFVISVTRRGTEFEKLQGVYATVQHLIVELHKAFAADNKTTASRPPS